MCISGMAINFQAAPIVMKLNFNYSFQGSYGWRPGALKIICLFVNLGGEGGLAGFFFFHFFFFFLSLITGLYVLFIHQLTCHFISYNIMRVLLNSIKWSFNWKAPLHFPIICSKLKADAHSLIRILILFPENQKSLSSCQDILQTQVNFEPPIFFPSSSEG